MGHLASEVDKTMKKRAVLSSQGWVVGGFVWFCVGWGFFVGFVGGLFVS